MGFKYLFWGFIFLFNFYIGDINILPHSVGYYLMYKGLTSLSLHSEKFEKASKFAIALIFLSLPNIFKGGYTVYGSEFIYFIVSITNIVLMFYLFYNLCLAVVDFAESNNNISIANSANMYSKIYIVYTVAIVLVNLSLLPELTSFVAIITFIGFQVGMIFFMYRCHKEYSMLT